MNQSTKINLIGCDTTVNSPSQLATDISWDYGHFQHAALNFFLICSLKMKCYGNVNHITQIVHSNAHLNHLKGIFSDKLFLIVEILSFQFAETRPL
jgi:hypothetical protein